MAKALIAHTQKQLIACNIKKATTYQRKTKKESSLL
jgi:hypothetical protein